jgi:hypothetical protein
VRPRIALAPDGGLAALADLVDVETRVAGVDLVGAEAELVLGRIGSVPVAAVLGGGVLATPLRLARLLGAEVLLLTRRVRALEPKAAPGQLGAIEDHLGLLVANPLIGPNLDELGPRFPDMSEPYDPALRALAREEARRAGAELAGGVYAAHPDPNLATAAEYSLLRRLGADWVGRGGVPEAIVARHAGMRVLGLVGTGASERPLADLTRRVVERLA